ncbi:MAG: type II toxin-antitoxin system prevent-host-death family antitoxin [Planctomycetaceae bacterium]|nr:type II toxin-antitoxin system prevent-host-death family antitoxin [Planctomycetaceae bacterium]
MQAITLKDAKRNLPQLIEQILADAEPRIVVTEAGDQVVVMPLDEFNSWKETLYLLANPANAEHLRRGIAEAESGPLPRLPALRSFLESFDSLNEADRMEAAAEVLRRVINRESEIHSDSDLLATDDAMFDWETADCSVDRHEPY